MGNQISGTNTGIHKILEDTAFVGTNTTAKYMACQNGLVMLNREPLLSKTTPTKAEERMCTANEIASKMKIKSYDGGASSDFYYDSDKGGFYLVNTSDVESRFQFDREGQNLSKCNKFNHNFLSSGKCTGDSINIAILKENAEDQLERIKQVNDEIETRMESVFGTAEDMLNTIRLNSNEIYKLPNDCSGRYSFDYVDASGSAGQCSETCGGGIKKRIKEYEIVREAVNGGQACDVPTSADYNDPSKKNIIWKEVPCNTQQCRACTYLAEEIESQGQCNASCGSGTKTVNYIKRVASDPDNTGCQPIRRSEQVACTGLPACPPDPVDCELNANWSAWEVKPGATCSKVCGGGKILKKKTRGIKIHAVGTGRACPAETSGERYEEREFDCNEQACLDCEFTERVEDVTQCSKDCGGGTKTIKKIRTITQNPTGDGQICPDLEEFDVVECNTDPCPVNCQLSDWTPWRNLTECDKGCGGGELEQERTRTIVQEAEHGGTECPGPEALKETRTEPCNTQACPKDCVVSEWSEWLDQGTCPEKCGGSKTQLRSRTIVQEQIGENSKECPSPEDLEETRIVDCPACEESEESEESQEQSADISTPVTSNDPVAKLKVFLEKKENKMMVFGGIGIFILLIIILIASSGGSSSDYE